MFRTCLELVLDKHPLNPKRNIHALHHIRSCFELYFSTLAEGFELAFVLPSSFLGILSTYRNMTHLLRNVTEILHYMQYLICFLIRTLLIVV